MKINHYFTYYCVLCCVTQVHGLTEKAEPVRSAENEKKLTSATEVLQKVCTLIHWYGLLSRPLLRIHNKGGMTK